MAEPNLSVFSYWKVVLGLGVHSDRAYWLVRRLSKVSVGATVCVQG